ARWLLENPEEPTQAAFEGALRLVDARDGGCGRGGFDRALLRDCGQGRLGVHGACFGCIRPRQRWRKLSFSQARAGALLVEPLHRCMPSTLSTANGTKSASNKRLRRTMCPILYRAKWLCKMPAIPDQTRADQFLVREENWARR